MLTVTTPVGWEASTTVMNIELLQIFKKLSPFIFNVVNMFSVNSTAGNDNRLLELSLLIGI